MSFAKERGVKMSAELERYSSEEIEKYFLYIAAKDNMKEEDAYILVLDCLKSLGRSDDIVALARRIINRYPYSEEIYSAWLSALLDKNRKREAIALLLRKEQYLGENVQSFIMLAGLYEELSETENALKYYKKVSDIMEREIPEALEPRILWYTFVISALKELGREGEAEVYRNKKRVLEAKL